ncbi:MAG: hypothetical protein P9M15_03265 [Candidatus Electryoneaceae bacterium]|nr:hypothetical protein [Candidatus Electryoneaceae bacterium]
MFNWLTVTFHKRMVILAIKYFNWRRKDEAIPFMDGWDDIRCCLVCLPVEGVSVQEAKVVLDRLRQRFPQAKITIMTLPGILDNLVQNISLSYDNLEILRINERMLSSSGLPKSSLRQQLNALDVDIAIDLSPQFVPLSAYLCQLSRAKIKVGFAGMSFGDLVFNYQIAPKPERTGIERYRVLAGYIG